MSPALQRHLAESLRVASFMTYLFGTARIELTGTTDRAVNERDLQIHLPFVIELIFVKSVDNFLGYLRGLLAVIFRVRPEALRSGEQVGVDLCFSTLMWILLSRL